MDTTKNIEAHRKTYGGFVEMLRWVVPALAVIIFIVILLIA
jgi:hypothetical protein